MVILLQRLLRLGCQIMNSSNVSATFEAGIICTSSYRFEGSDPPTGLLKIGEADFKSSHL